MVRSEDATTIPALTQQAAHAAFPKSNTIMQLRDALGPIFDDADFASLYPDLGQPAESPARLALVTILQFVENLTDRQAADAVRSRIDWKYALGLDLGDPGFHYSVLSEFRARLIAGGQERLLLDRLLTCCAAQGLLQGASRQRTDSTHVLAAVRAVSLLELVGESMRRTLEAIARCAPAWLHQHLDSAWIERYGWRFERYRLPKRAAEQQTLAETIGRDGRTLLDHIAAAETPADVKDLPIVATLRRIWWQQFYCDGEAVHWRVKKQWGQPPSNQMVVSPDDVDAR